MLFETALSETGLRSKDQEGGYSRQELFQEDG